MLRRFARMLDDEALPLPTRVPDMSRPIPPSSPGHEAVRCGPCLMTQTVEIPVYMLADPLPCMETMETSDLASAQTRCAEGIYVKDTKTYQRPDAAVYCKDEVLLTQVPFLSAEPLMFWSVH